MEVTEKDLLFMKRKYPLKSLFKSPSISASPAILYLLLEAKEQTRLLRLLVGEENTEEDKE